MQVYTPVLVLLFSMSLCNAGEKAAAKSEAFDFPRLLFLSQWETITEEFNRSGSFYHGAHHEFTSKGSRSFHCRGELIVDAAQNGEGLKTQEFIEYDLDFTQLGADRFKVIKLHIFWPFNGVLSYRPVELDLFENREFFLVQERSRQQEPKEALSSDDPSLVMMSAVALCAPFCLFFMIRALRQFLRDNREPHGG